MKINKIQINGYGKLKDKKLKLEDGINVIYGDNEAGKSTLLNFITNSFYGISKNKKGKEMSDFEKYNPWDEGEFSGKVQYQLDDGNEYEIYRDFKKKNPQIFDKDKIDISKEFNIDKTKGNEFFYEQTKIDEELFKSTFLVNQQEVKLDNANQHMLIQKISNLVGTGEDNVSYKLAMSRLNRKQLEEVGTQRSREKPINILTREIEEIEAEKEELKKYKDLKYEIEENKNSLQERITDLENRKLVANEIKNIEDNNMIEDEKIKMQENLQKENRNKIYELEKEKNEKEIEEGKLLEIDQKIKSKIKSLTIKMILGLILLAILNVLEFVFIKNEIIGITFLLTIPVFLIFYIVLKNKLKNKLSDKKLEEIKIEKSKIENQINIIEENNKKIKEEITRIEEEKNSNNEKENEKIKNKFKNINEKEINNLINKKNIKLEIDNIQNLINKNKLKLHELELDKENIEPKLDDLSKLEEKLTSDKERLLDIKNKEKSIELAKKVLTNSYEKMKQEVIPKFTKQLSENIGVITKGKYTKAMYNENEGLIVEPNNGNYVNANKLSIGTIDQLYLSLRLSMIDDLAQEKLPIIIDEGFAYYDNDRLKNILSYFSEKFKNRQIIIFTCTNREKENLEKLNIEFNFINFI